MLTVHTPISRSVIQKAFGPNFWIRKVRRGVYRVMNRKLREGRIRHGAYELFASEDRQGNPVISGCWEYRRNEPCPAFQWHGYCSHSVTLLNHLIQIQERRAA